MRRSRPLRWLAVFTLCAAVLAWVAVFRRPAQAVTEAGEALHRQAPVQPAPSLASPGQDRAPNEAGQIMILMYHRFSPKPGAWNRTPQEFRRDLEVLYRQGYRLLPLHDLLSGRITTPRGFTPVVLTFDDGWQSQFNYLTGPDGQAAVDSESAVGILAEFARRHPDMGLAGTFYLNANPFGHPALAQKKLRYLVSHGFELGNHTLNHANLRRITPEQGARELAQLAMLVAALVPGYRLE
ncbi:MAG TPA: polysaccharide deacetylase family protein, partial [Firmicutes bacterium]|nr:polysaccharide deacetylase family protein [Bacillota bacterium]